MSIFPASTAAALAESLGFKLSDEALSLLTHDAEYRLREVVHGAQLAMNVCHREKLVRGIFIAHLADVDSALKLLGMAPLLGHTNNVAPVFRKVANVHYQEDQEFNLLDLINAPLPPAPQPLSFTAHWLAIDGIQPRIVQNPTSAALLSKQIPTSSLAPAPTSTLSHPPIKQLITQELQAYYELIISGVMSKSPKDQKTALNSVRTDPGIQGLMPYFVQFVVDTLANNSRTLWVMWAIMRFVSSLLMNKNVFVEPYLHQIAPCILTIILTRKLTSEVFPGEQVMGVRGGDDGILGDSYALRVYAAELNAHVCHTYSKIYATLSPRATKTLIKGMLSKFSETVFGAVVGLKCLVGDDGIRMLVLPNINILFMHATQPPQESEALPSNVAADRVMDAVVEVCSLNFRACVEEKRIKFPRDDDKSLVEACAEECRQSKVYGGFHDAVLKSLESVYASK